MPFKRVGLFTVLAVSAAAMTACSSLGFGSKTTTYEAQLYPLNIDVTDAEATGTAKMEITGDTLVITVDMAGVPPNTVHWQHLHGLKTGGDASCARQSDDVNGDNIVDLIETERASGTTLVPFNDAPAKLDIPHGTYPTATPAGTYHYRQEVSLKELEKAFAKAYDGQELALDTRVVYVHGVPANTQLPGSVASLGPVPAHVTLPIACGKFTKR